jgi:hypothetical protein
MEDVIRHCLYNLCYKITIVKHKTTKVRFILKNYRECKDLMKLIKKHNYGITTIAINKDGLYQVDWFVNFLLDSDSYKFNFELSVKLREVLQKFTNITTSNLWWSDIKWIHRAIKYYSDINHHDRWWSNVDYIIKF